MQKFVCSICGYVYDESAGAPEKGVVLGTKWENLSEGFACPICGAPKTAFKSSKENSTSPVVSINNVDIGSFESPMELSPGVISAICSNLAKACEKQRLNDEMDAFNKLADYFKSKTVPVQTKTLTEASKMLDDDLAKRFVDAITVTQTNTDRGALRSLVWSEKVSQMVKLLLERFNKEGDAMLENTKIWVCDICGFIYIGDAPPEICPICKVPNFKIIEVERRQ